MNRLKTMSALPSLLLVLTACGGGGSGGGAGIGGTGYQSRGTVTEFGSIFVNGVEFETTSAVFEIEDATGSQSDLRVGMRVEVEGTVDANGTTGVATRVRFEDQLEGPIPQGSTISEDADGENKSFTILGVPVTVNDIDTTFVGTTYAGLTPGENLQISGFYDANGLLRATAVVRRNTFVPGATVVEAKGIVSNLGASTLNLRVGAVTLTVDFTAADLSRVPGGLLNGQLVEVKGTIASDTATSLAATAIKLEDDDFAEGTQVELEGLVTSFGSLANFAVDGQAVSAGSATFTPAGFTVRSGIKVEVEGTIQNGVLQATAVKLREGTLRVHATASNVNTTTNTFELTVAGQTVRVTVNTSTELEDKTSSTNLTLANLGVLNGRFVEVRGYDDGSGNGLVASRLEIDSPDDVILQGVIEGQVQGASITVLGVTFPVDATTEYQDANNTALPGGQTQFASGVVNGTTLIRLKDKAPGSGGANPVGVADEVEIQAP